MKTRNKRLIGLVIALVVLSVFIFAISQSARTPKHRATRLNTLNRVAGVTLTLTNTNSPSSGTRNQQR
jgi:hypothetical protein